MNGNDVRQQLDTTGYAVLTDVLDVDTVSCLLAELSNAENETAHRRNGSVYALRNLLETIPAVVRLAASDVLRRCVTPVLGPDAFAVRGVLFDKTPDANWRVNWHQDRMIAVQEARTFPGFGPWSVKEGVVHVGPPSEVLEAMLTVRLHLDPCSEENGPLRVLPGTHRLGRLDPATIAECREQITPISVPVPCGGALLMRPLLLHASSPALVPGHRRVVHLDFAECDLPGGLEWQTRIRVGEA